MLNLLRRLWTAAYRDFPEQGLLDARRARLLATMASQVAHAKAQRDASIRQAENARIVEERERRAAAMPADVSPDVSIAGRDVERTASWEEWTRLHAPRRGTVQITMGADRVATLSRPETVASPPN